MNIGETKRKVVRKEGEAAREECVKSGKEEIEMRFSQQYC